MKSGYMPPTDQGFLSWSGNFGGKIALKAYNLTPEWVADYTDAQTTFATSMVTINNPATRTSVTIAQKDAAKAALVELTRLTVSLLEGWPELTDADRLDLGLTVRKTPAPIPAPAEAPVVDRVSMRGHRLTLRLHDEASTRRAKPAGVSGASIFTHVGETAPASLDDWTFRLSTGRTSATLDFDSDLPPGTRVWVTAYWFNPRKQPGPYAEPQSVLIQYGLDGGSAMRAGTAAAEAAEPVIRAAA